MQILKVGHIKNSSSKYQLEEYRGLIIIWKCTQPFLEFIFLPCATMNESEHINFFARQKIYIFLNVNLVEMWFEFISSSLRRNLTLISWFPISANKYGLFYWRGSIQNISLNNGIQICSRQFLMIFFSQQIEGIEAMLDEQADQEQVDNSSLSPNKKDHGLKIENMI